MKKLTIKESKNAAYEISVQNWSRKEAIIAMTNAIAHLVGQMEKAAEPKPDPPKTKPTGQASLFIQE